MTYHDTLTKVGILLTQKNRAYGDNAHKSFERFGSISYIIRLSDKAERMKQLDENPDIDTGDEAWIDTCFDMIGYVLLFCADLYYDLFPDDETDVEDRHIRRTLDYVEELTCLSSEEIESMATIFKNSYISNRTLVDLILSFDNDDGPTPTELILFVAYLVKMYCDFENRKEQENGKEAEEEQ